MSPLRTSILTALVAVALVGASWLYFFHAQEPAEDGASFFSDAAANAAPVVAFAQDATTSDPTAPRTPPERCGQIEGATCEEYRNQQYGFSLFHSSKKDIKEYDEGGGAMTITFENIEDARGFQIFIVPYSGTKVTPERFKRDIPSGVMKDPVNVTVDGAFGTMFFSKDAVLGETREIWFIHNGYLFEITTLKLLDGPLQERMQTWKFI